MLKSDKSSCIILLVGTSAFVSIFASSGRARLPQSKADQACTLHDLPPPARGPLYTVAAGGNKKPLTVRDAMEMTWIAKPLDGALSTISPTGNRQIPLRDPVTLSPDGRSWAVMTVRGDIAADGNWIEIIGGTLEDWSSASRVRVIATFFSRSLGDGWQGNGSVYLTTQNPLVWAADSRSLALLWKEDAIGSATQVLSVDFATGQKTILTDSPTNVLSFSYGPNRQVSYISEPAAPAFSPEEKADRDKNGYVVDQRNAQNFLAGIPEISTAPSTRREIHLINKFGEKKVLSFPAYQPGLTPVFSPSGKFLLFLVPTTQVSDRWKRLPNFNGKAAVYQLYVADTDDGQAKPLLNLPYQSSEVSLKASFSPSGTQLAIGPTYVDGNIETGGRSYGVVDLATSSAARIQLPKDITWRDVQRIRWDGEARILLDAKMNGIIFSETLEKNDGRWVSSGRQYSLKAHQRSPLSVVLREGANLPPYLSLVDDISPRREKVIYDPTPDLRSRYRLSQVKQLIWRDADGRVWEGRFYPGNGEASHKMPLVIQTHGIPTLNEFSVWGPAYSPGVGPSLAGHAAQPLAARGISVLQIEDKVLTGIFHTPQEPKLALSGITSAIDCLSSLGTIDKSKVGLLGQSRTGWHVEYALSHSNYKFSAAVVADNYDASYLQALMGGWPLDEYSTDIGGEPYGNGLDDWLKESVTFSSSRIRTPLLLVNETGGFPPFLGHGWEMYRQLTWQDKPVELYMLPHSQYGAHQIQNPAQNVAEKTRTVDWFDFWLNGHEDHDPRKNTQYARWRAMRALEATDAMKLPR